MEMELRKRGKDNALIQERPARHPQDESRMWLSNAQEPEFARVTDERIAISVGPQVAVNCRVSGNQQIRLGSLRDLTQMLPHVAALDDYFRIRARVLLKLGDFAWSRC